MNPIEPNVNSELSTCGPSHSIGECLSQAVERPLSIVDRVEIELQKARHKVADLEAALELLHKYPDIAQLLKYLRSL